MGFERHNQFISIIYIRPSQYLVKSPASTFNRIATPIQAQITQPMHFGHVARQGDTL